MPRRFDYMERIVAAQFGAEVFSNKGSYFVVLSEPSTGYLAIKAWTDSLAAAKKKAAAQVDDACKTSGWVFQPTWYSNEDIPQELDTPELICLGYAYFGVHWLDDVSGSGNGPEHPSDDKVTL
jgi:hypothetical protein